VRSWRIEMQFYEFEGKNQEDAIANAMKTLNVSREELNVEVLEPGSAGIFGIVGGKKAKIRVWLKRDEEEKKKKELPLKTAKEMLEQILGMVTKGRLEISGHVSDSIVSLDVKGDDAGILIGKNGQTLEALQYVLNRMVNKQLEKKVLVVVDIENYRQRRKEGVTQMAKRMGEKAKKLKKPVATALLNAKDRRVIHLALKDDRELETKSKGEGTLKRVVIYPRLRNKQERSKQY